MHLFVTILENGHHLGFSIYQSDRIYLITIEMSHANFGACITLCTIHPKNATYLLHCKSVTTCPNGNVTTCPNVISITIFMISFIFIQIIEYIIMSMNTQLGNCIGVRANIHLGGQTEFCPNGFSGGGVVAEIFRDPYSVGGGGVVVAEIFRDPYYMGGRIFSLNGSGRPSIRFFFRYLQ